MGAAPGMAAVGSRLAGTPFRAASARIVIGLVLLLFVPEARCQQFDHVITFGDSLSDAGNVFALTSSLANRFPQFSAKPASPPHFSGRFSNGPVWAEILAASTTGAPMNNLYSGIALRLPPRKLLNPAVGNVNTAVGGSRADAQTGFEPLGFGLPRQISDFQSAGGTIGANDLVTAWSGGNDIFQSATAGRGPAAAAVAAARAQTANVSRLVNDLGARTLLVPNMLPPPPQLVDAVIEAPFPVTEYNETLDAGLEALAAANPRANIVQADVTSMFRIIEADPSTFGFRFINLPCAGGDFVTGAVDVCARPDEHFLFHNVHPGARGHRYIALYARLLLSVPESSLVMAPLVETSLYSRMDASRSAYNRVLDAVTSPQTWKPGTFVGIINRRIEGDARGTVPGYRLEGTGIGAGFAASVGAAIAGAAVAYVPGDHRQSGLSASARTVEADVYTLFDLRSFFLSLDAGVSYTDFDNIRRDTGFGRLDPIPVEEILTAPLVADASVVFAEGDTDGWAHEVAVGAGSAFDAGDNLRLVPHARAGYLQADVDPFDETAPILALSYGGREITTGFWSTALRATAGIRRQSHELSATVELGYEGLFSTRTGKVEARLMDNTAVPVSIDVEDPPARGPYLSVGLEGYLDASTVLSAGLSLSLDGGEISGHTGTLALRFLFGG